ncbi:MAG: agmatinase [Chloroflexota bacterium]|nr:agmatinase [Chloroflexota bacterium]
MTGSPTFMGIPPDDGRSTGGLVVLGIPFDNGGQPDGADRGPESIRRHSHQVRRHFIDRSGDPLERLSARDAGDVAVEGSLVDAEAAIELTAERVLARGATPLTMGGDGSVTLPQLRAASARFPDMCVLHVDAHTDAYPETGEQAHAASTAFSRALEEGVLRAADTVHIGLHGTTRRPGLLEYARELGFGAHTIDEMTGDAGREIVASLHRRFAGRPLYLCWDMDVIDPSAAPGVLAPVWGGFSAREAIGLIRALTGLAIVYCDINGTCANRDPHGLTATLAAHLMVECCCLVLQGAAAEMRTPG